MKRMQGKSYIYKISTSNRRLIKQVKRHKAEVDHFIDPLPSEIDNHADTTCFGKNFRVISFTTEVCSVSPYLSEYNSIDDIPICTAATAVDLDTGETIILEFGQGLWFGDRMNHSLIYPNQCRVYGLSVCDDPTDQHRDIGMQLHDNYFLPFKMRGTTCYFESRSPTEEELESYFKFLTTTIGIRQMKCLFQPSNGDKCVCLNCLMCVRLNCVRMNLTYYRGAQHTSWLRSELLIATMESMPTYFL